MANTVKYFTIKNPENLSDRVRNYITTDMVFIVKSEEDRCINYEVNGYMQVIRIENIVFVSEHCQRVKFIYG